MRSDLSIPRKANRILNLILLAFLLILIRVWYLGFVQRDHHVQQARKPQRKSTVEKVERATIRDRFNIPLAQNKISYSAAIRYADLREIPSHRWRKDEKGVKVKEPVRGPYISALAAFLAKELSMDPEVIEDVIYAKASLFPHTPFILKEGLSEQEYYRIRSAQKDWVGVEAERGSQREYPFGKIACDVVGYIGAINSKEYVKIAEEMRELQTYIKKRELGEIVFLPKGYQDPFEVRTRLKILQEKAYTINDQVGKTGIEESCDELLRGTHGKKMYEIDPKGNILRELPGSKKGVSGERVFLAISAELQQHAEELLAQHEVFRDVKDRTGQVVVGSAPWIKGGAIVALDPKTGEIVALASYPRFDPNDFIPGKTAGTRKEKQMAIAKWLENETHIGNVWNGKSILSRELYVESEKRWIEEIKSLSWDVFLESILSPNSALKKVMDGFKTVSDAYLLQQHFERVKEACGIDDPSALIHVLYSTAPHLLVQKEFPSDLLNLMRNNLSSAKEEIDESLQFLDNYFRFILHNQDKLLLLDLLRLVVSSDLIDESLIEEIGHFSLVDFFGLIQSLKKVQDYTKEKVETLHHEIGFKEWRKNYFKAFLKEKRKEEKAARKYAKPYTEYLEKIEKNLFKKFWNACKPFFLDAIIYREIRVPIEEYPQLLPYVEELTQDMDPSIEAEVIKLKNAMQALNPFQAMQCMKAMRSFEELTRPLYGKYRQLRNTQGIQLEKHLAASFYPLTGFGYGRSQAFRQSTPLGSVFKLTVAYEALKERYEYLKANHLSLKDLNPLTIIDQIQMSAPYGSLKQLLGYTMDGQPIHRLYKGGVLPRTHPNIGKIDLVGAIEQSSNIYFSLLAAEHISDAFTLEKTTRDMGFGAKTGIDLPGEIAGSIPNDLADNKTGLYSFAIGQHALIGTPLQTAVMFSSLVRQGDILKPQIVSLTVGQKVHEDPFSLKAKEDFPFQEPLALVGVDFPLFTESLHPSYNPAVHTVSPEVRRSLFLPSEIRSLLFEGMDRVITGAKGTAKRSLIHYFRKYPESAKHYDSLKGRLVGKTGTAEFFYKPWMDSESKVQIRNHIWFAGAVFPEGVNPLESNVEEADLVIVVYLRFSQAGGKEATPLAAQIATKWTEIQKRYGAKSYLDSMLMEEVK
jgi:cell division protein FtsI/penicillin-binding protein 2